MDPDELDENEREAIDRQLEQAVEELVTLRIDDDGGAGQIARSPSPGRERS